MGPCLLKHPVLYALGFFALSGCSDDIIVPADEVDLGMNAQGEVRMVTPELRCDRFDEDGDGVFDEGLVLAVPCSTNQCGPGTTACNPGFGPSIICVPTTPNATGVVEQCNQLDDDCDGLVDEGLAPVGMLCGQSTTPNQPRDNQAQPANDPNANNQNPNDGRMEICDRQDNDGDGRLDEGLTNACGQCGPEPMEMCNGRDDDCDGMTDEGVLNACGTCGDGEPEVCDGQDNDCDGMTDEGFQLNACGECSDALAEQCNGLDDDCDDKIDEQANCPCPTGLFMDKSYMFCRGDQKTWAQAQMACQSVSYDLVIINSAQEDSFVYGRLAADGFGDTWIGLSDQAQENNFVWVDGTSINAYDHWDSGEPNDGGGGEDCAIIMRQPQNRQTKWDDRPCSTRYDYVCESP